MALTRKEASEKARKGRLEQSVNNLEFIYDRIERLTKGGDIRMILQGEYLLPEVYNELLKKGYTVHPVVGNNYEDRTGKWIIYWGYSDDVKDFTEEEDKLSFT